MFTEELLAAYPDAKVLITTREEESLLWSVSTLFNTLLSWPWDVISSYDTVIASRSSRITNISLWQRPIGQGKAIY